MVRHLEQPCGKQSWPVEQELLAGDLDVARQQHGPPRVRHPQHDRRVVQLTVRATERAPRRRTKNLHGQFADHGCLPGLRFTDRDPTGLSRRGDLVLVLRMLRYGPVPQGPHGHGREHVAESPDVIRVRMTDHQEVEGHATSA